MGLQGISAFNSSQKYCNERSSNIELLRIIAMILIIMHHFSVHGNFPFTQDLAFSKIFIQLFGFGGKVGVDIFTLITGYFMISTNFKLEKFIKLIGQIWFYSIIILGFSLYMKLDTINYESIILSILPFGSLNWFAHVFLVLYALIPFINRILHCISKKYYKRILILLTIFWFILPTFINFWQGIPHKSFGFNQYLLFIYLYSLGAYIRLYNISIENRKSLKLVIMGLIGIIFGHILIDILTLNNFVYIHQILYFDIKDYGIFQLLIAIGLFYFFKNINIKYKWYINVIASTTFGIYLIHDNALIINEIWNGLFKTYQYYNSLLLPIYAVIIVFSVFIFGMIIDNLRILFIERPLMSYLTPIIKRYQKWS